MWCCCLLNALVSSFPRISWGIPYVTTKTLRKWVQTVYTFPKTQVKLTSIQPSNQTPVHFDITHRIGVQKVRLTKSHQEDIYDLIKSAKHRQIFSLIHGKWWLKKLRPFIPEIRNDATYDGLMPYYLLSSRPQVAVTL